MPRFYKRNRIMVLGTAGVDENGELYLSEYAKSRVHRAAEAYYDSMFDRESGQILIAGGYSKELKGAPPSDRESRMLGRFLLEQYGSIPEEALRLEDASTKTEENFSNSLELYPDFFEEIRLGDRKLVLVSHPYHLERAIRVGGAVLGCTGNWFVKQPTSRSDNKQNEKEAMKKIQPRIEELQVEAMRMAADS